MFPIQTVLDSIEASWQQLGWVQLQIHVESGVGHNVSVEGWGKASNFMQAIIEKQQVKLYSVYNFPS